MAGALAGDHRRGELPGGLSLESLVFGAALRAGSTNARLASLVARLITENGATAVR